MILKKPYAFLIKNFKIIHLVLLAVIFYANYKYNAICTFFSDYAKNGVNIVENMGSNYVNSIFIFSIVLIIIFSLLMFLLMNNKKKPTLFYIMLLGYYVLILVASLVASSTINELYEISETQQSLRAYKEIYFILSLPAYYFMIMSLIRGIGFDVKKFNFSKDLNELEINSKDNEEFEFVLGTDSYKVKRKVRRYLRELKYYVLENKIIFATVGGVIIGLVAVAIVLDTNIFNKKYKVGDTSSVGQFSYKLNASYITENDYNGNIIRKNKKYIVLDVSITNMGKAASIDESALYLGYGENSSVYTSSVSEYFGDLGIVYSGGIINASSTQRVLLLFEVSSKTNYSTYSLNILKSITYDDENKPEYDYVKYKIKPINLDKDVNSETKNLNELMFLGNTVFKNSSIIIKSIKFVSSYEYQYESCDNGDCRTLTSLEKATDSSSQFLMVIDYELNINENATIINAMVAKQKPKYIFDKFLKIKYVSDGNSKEKGLTARYNEKVPTTVFVDISKKIYNTANMTLHFKTRENRYYIKLK